MYNYFRERPIQPNEVENALHNIRALTGGDAESILAKYPATDSGILSAYEEVSERIFKELIRF